MGTRFILPTRQTSLLKTNRYPSRPGPLIQRLKRRTLSLLGIVPPPIADVGADYVFDALQNAVWRPPLGPDMVTNGDFADGEADWTFAEGWSASNGAAHKVGEGTTGIVQAMVIEAGKLIKVDLNPTFVSGSVTVRLLGGNSVASYPISVDGPTSVYLRAGDLNHNNLQILGSFTSELSVTDIAVREVLEASGELVPGSIRERTENASYAAKIVKGNSGKLVDVPANQIAYDWAYGLQQQSLEPASENLTYRSGDPWNIPVFFGLNPLEESNDTTPKDGDSVAVVTEDTSFSNKQLNLEAPETIAGETYTFSAIVKALSVGAKRYIGLRGFGEGAGAIWPIFDIELGVVVRQGTDAWSNAQIVEIFDGWYLCTATIVASHITDPIIQLTDVDTAEGAHEYQGDGVSGIYAYSWQVENLNYATSLMRAEGDVSATREADLDKLSDLFFGLVSNGEGSILLTGTIDTPDNQLATLFSIDDGTTSNRIQLLHTDGDTLLLSITSDGVNDSTTGPVVPKGDRFAVAFRFTAGDVSVSFQGDDAIVSGSAVVPSTALIAAYLNQRHGNGATQLPNQFLQFAFSSNLWSDEELKALTTVMLNYDPTSTVLDEATPLEDDTELN